MDEVQGAEVPEYVYPVVRHVAGGSPGKACVLHDGDRAHTFIRSLSRQHQLLSAQTEIQEELLELICTRCLIRVDPTGRILVDPSIAAARRG